MLHRDSAECRRLRSPASWFQPTRAVQGPAHARLPRLWLSLSKAVSLCRVYALYPPTPSGCYWPFFRPLS